MKNSPFASKSTTDHLVRGLVGFSLLGAGIVLATLYGPVGLLLAPLGLLALRGCPGCWVLGLVETISHGKTRRACVDGTCRLTTAEPEGRATS